MSVEIEHEALILCGLYPEYQRLFETELSAGHKVGVERHRYRFVRIFHECVDLRHGLLHVVVIILRSVPARYRNRAVQHALDFDFDFARNAADGDENHIAAGYKSAVGKLHGKVCYRFAAVIGRAVVVDRRNGKHFL